MKNVKDLKKLVPTGSTAFLLEIQMSKLEGCSFFIFLELYSTILRENVLVIYNILAMNY